MGVAEFRIAAILNLTVICAYAEEDLKKNGRFEHEDIALTYGCVLFLYWEGDDMLP